MLQISSYHHTKQDGSKQDPIILQYNLDSKVQKHYQYMCKDGYNTICWYFPTNYTDYLAPLDAGARKISSFGLEFTFMSGFGTLEIWSYSSWDDSMLPIRKY